MIAIDREFIAMWHLRYEETENDEGVYIEIRSHVLAEVCETGTIERDTFLQLLDWKSPRLKGIIKKDRLDEYLERIAEVGRSAERERLPLLLGLHGIGVPTASTILHFMYPDRYPILDVRTIEVLFEAGYISSRSKGPCAYPSFCAAVRRIKSAAPMFTLREIDRAIFAYHKVGLKRTTRTKPAPGAAPHSGSPPNKVPDRWARGLTNHEKLACILSRDAGREMSTEELRRVVEQHDPDFCPGSVLPNDHAEGNKGACWCAKTDRRLFDRLRRGRYRVR